MADEAGASLAEPEGSEAMTRGGSWQVRGVLYPLASLAICILAWQLVVSAFGVPDYLLPRPAQVAAVLAKRFDVLLYHTWITSLEAVLGFVLSIAIGVPIALAIVSARWVEQSVYPLLVLSQAVPKVAIAPLLLVWIGFGLGSKILVAVLIAFFPVTISTVVGLRSVPTDMIDLGRSMGLSWLDMFVKIRLPHSLPSIFGGLKVSITLAVVGAVVGEFVGADRGLGYVLLLASGQLDTPTLFAAIVLLVVVGVASFAVIQWAERILLPWHASVTEVVA